MSDALVIGGGASGLVAATYLARAGRNVTLLEASSTLGGVCRNIVLGNGWIAPGAVHLLHAFDPQVMKELELARHGLRLAERDLALTGFSADGRCLTLTRNLDETTRQLTPFSRTDAVVFGDVRHGLLREARKLRRLWWHGEDLAPDAAVEQLAVTGAAALLNLQFESEVLKALLAFDATDGGLSVLEPGSALTLVWRLTQEVGGFAGAVARPEGGTGALITALTAAAVKAGVRLRRKSEVKNILVEGSAVCGMRLASGEVLQASLIFSSLPKPQTLALLPPGAAGLASPPATHPSVGAARILLALGHAPGLQELPFGARFVTMDGLEALVAAHTAARSGFLPDDLPVEFILLPAPDGGAILSVLVRPVPLTGWPQHTPHLIEKLLARLEPLMPDLRRAIVTLTVMTPQDLGASGPAPSVAHMLSPPRTRVTTTVDGLYLCGNSAEPVPSVSGHAARLAAALAMKEMP